MTSANSSVLVLGGEGRLAAALKRADPVCVRLASKAECNVLRTMAFARMLIDLRPRAVVNCAAVVTDRSEHDKASAWNVNAIAPGQLAYVCRGLGVRFAHISTDYVFSGNDDEDKPEGNYYGEDAIPEPQNFYGLSKLVGEAGVLYSNCDALVLRAPFRYGPPWPYPRAFHDQWTSGRFIDEVAPDILKLALSDCAGLLHVPGPRRRIFDLAQSVSPDVKITYRSCVKAVRIPYDTSLSTIRGGVLQHALA